VLSVPVAVAVEGVSKRFVAGGAPVAALAGLTLRVWDGEFVSLLGPSGVGKSTVLNLVAGLEAPDTGSVSVAGVAVGSAAGPAAGHSSADRGRPPPIAYMQQKDLLLPWRTVWDNILLGPELRSAAERRRMTAPARRLLAEFGLEAFTGAWPAELSGGMRQRAALIRTLLCERPVLLLDEPFGALDAITRGRLQVHLAKVWRDLNKTVLLVTHDVDEALLLSTRIVLLGGPPGRVEEEVEVPAEMDETARLRLRAHVLRRLDALTPEGA
jgi:ABC-type nitrate/sulfonate/bicarbonate transport system ATPase subunit